VGTMVDRKAMLEAVLSLPPQERLTFVHEVWDSLADQPEALKLSPAQEEELDLALREYADDPTAGDDWPTVKARILGPRS